MCIQCICIRDVCFVFCARIDGSFESDVLMPEKNSAVGTAVEARNIVLVTFSGETESTIHSRVALGQLLRSGGSPNRFAYEYVLGATIGPGLFSGHEVSISSRKFGQGCFPRQWQCVLPTRCTAPRSLSTLTLTCTCTTYLAEHHGVITCCCTLSVMPTPLHTHFFFSMRRYVKPTSHTSHGENMSTVQYTEVDINKELAAAQADAKKAAENAERARKLVEEAESTRDEAQNALAKKTTAKDDRTKKLKSANKKKKGAARRALDKAEGEVAAATEGLKGAVEALGVATRASQDAAIAEEKARDRVSVATQHKQELADAQARSAAAKATAAAAANAVVEAQANELAVSTQASGSTSKPKPNSKPKKKPKVEDKPASKPIHVDAKDVPRLLEQAKELEQLAKIVLSVQ